MDNRFKTKWENNNNNNYNFDKDYGNYDTISWRQRSFMCNFCKKEYKSAQALGGHMNVHRRDRARLRQSSPPSLDLSIPNPNPNPSFSSPPSSLMCVPFNAFHSSLLSLDLCSPSLTMNNEDKHNMFPFVPHSNSVWNFLGDMRKNVNNDQENESRVWEKKDGFRVEIEKDLVTDGNIEMGLDLELRLGRS